MAGFFSNLSIRFRVILPILGMMVAVTTFILFFFPWRQRALDKEVLQNKAMNVARAITDTAAVGVELEDRTTVERALNWTKHDPDVAYAVVRAADGQEFASHVLEGAKPSSLTEAPSQLEVTGTGAVIEVAGPIRHEGAIIGSVQVGLFTEVIAANYRRGLWTAFLFNFVVAVLAIATMLVVGRQITEPIVKLTNVAEQIATDDMKRIADETRIMASGDLTREVQVEPRRIEVATAGEIGRMASSFNLMLHQLSEIAKAFNLLSAGLRNIVVHVQTAADEVATGSDSVAAATGKAARGNDATVASVEGITSTLHEMNANLQNVARNAQSQSASTTETLASIENMLRSVQTVAGVAERLVQIANRTSRAVSEGGEAMEAASQGMAEIRDVIQSSAQYVQNLGGMAEDIARIVGVIDEIAEQSNLLALNAAIEAARAGEHGLGFSVVAEEVRKLAERSAGSTKEIAELVNRIQSQVSRAVDNMDKSTAIVEQGMRRTEELGSNLQNIGQSVKEVSTCSHEIGQATAEQSAGTHQIEQAISGLGAMTHEISAATEQQSSGTEQMVDSIEQIQAMVQQNAEGASELAASSEELSRQAALMRELTSRFQMSSEEHRAPGTGTNGETGRDEARKLRELVDSADTVRTTPDGWR